MSTPPGVFYEFGEFRLDAGKNRVLRHGELVALTPRAVETLRVLIEHRGNLVEREALLNAVWRDVVVEDGNLTVTVSMIRKALGDDANDRRFIETVPRLGYKFVADVRVVEDEHSSPSVRSAVSSSRPRSAPERSSAPQTVRSSAISPVGILAPPPVGILAPPPVRSSAWVSRPRWIAVSAAAVIVLAVALAYARPWSRPAPAIAGGVQSIAVLPLTSLSGIPDDKALGLGFADTLMTSLAAIGDVRVRSTHGMNLEIDGQRPPQDIGRALAVDAVLGGTLQRANGMLRVTLRLIRTSDGAQIWSDSFDEAESEIFKLQDAMASGTAQSLKLNLTADQQQRIHKRYTNNRDAYHAYLLGRLFFDRRQADGYEKAIAEFERAIALDPSYALALTGLADVYALQANVRTGTERDALYEKSKTMATRALQLDEGLAEAHTSLGWVKRVRDWDWAGSEAEFKRALELNPSDANAHQWYALLLTTLGRTDEAIKEADIARELAPLSSIVLQNYFTILQHRGEHQRLPDMAEQIARLAEDEWVRTRSRAIAYDRAGDHAKVIEIGEAYRSENEGRTPPDSLVAQLAIAYGRTHQESKAKAMMAHLEQQAKTDSHAVYLLATVHAELGRRDEAIALLEQALAAHDDRMVWLKVEPRFDSLRDDERFKALMRRMNL